MARYVRVCGLSSFSVWRVALGVWRGVCVCVGVRMRTAIARDEEGQGADQMTHGTAEISYKLR